MLIGWIATLIFAAQVIDFEMSPDEKRHTGVYKLSDKEKGALQHWVDNNYSKRNQPLKQPIQDKAVIEENLNNGGQIRLSDGSLWTINPKDTPITQSWITPVEIFVTQSGNKDYPYKLTNSLTGSSVRAKKGE